MTPQEAIYFINSEIQIDVRFCSKEKVDKTKEALEYAISALEKQIPKKVDVREEGRSVKIYRCFTCGKPIATSICDDVVVGYKQNYCDKCGQALDWSDTE